MFYELTHFIRHEPVTLANGERRTDVGHTVHCGTTRDKVTAEEWKFANPANNYSVFPGEPHAVTYQPEIDRLASVYAKYGPQQVSCR